MQPFQSHLLVGIEFLQVIPQSALMHCWLLFPSGALTLGTTVWDTLLVKAEAKKALSSSDLPTSAVMRFSAPFSKKTTFFFLPFAVTEAVAACLHAFDVPCKCLPSESFSFPTTILTSVGNIFEFLLHCIALILLLVLRKVRLASHHNRVRP